MTPLAHRRDNPAVIGLILSLLLQAPTIFAAPVDAPAFELSKWETGEKVSRSDFAGQIVVLDFFAYWCVPCRRASAEVEGGIQKYDGRNQIRGVSRAELHRPRLVHQPDAQ